MCALRFESWVARLALIAGACAVTGAHAEEAKAEDGKAPLFRTFKSFCADTGARADAVKEAVLAAGGTPQNPPTKSTTAPFPMETSLWDLTVDGQAMVVAAGRAHTGGARDVAMADCVISGRVTEEASLLALAGWAGVPAHPSSTPQLTYYVFEQTGSRHKALGDAAAAQAAEVDGRIWRLSVIRAPGLVTVDLMHALGKTQ